MEQYTNDRKEIVGLTALRKRMMEELRVRNLSEITRRLYLCAVERFCKVFRPLA